jgi:hypothetical protein
VTVVQDRETLTRVDDETQRELEAAGAAFKQAPEQLKAAIITAARKGGTPAKIVRAIGHVYTYDYVARLVRADRAAYPGEYHSS